MIVIGGVDMPSPSAFRVPNFDVDSVDTYRNELGVLQRDRIRSDIYKLELDYRAINSSALVTIKSAIAPVQFEVSFISETGMITKTMYVGDRNIEMVKYDTDTDNIRWNVNFNLIEY